MRSATGLSGGAGRARCTLAALVLASCVVACADEVSNPVASDELQDIQASQVLFGMSSYLTTEGVREGRVQADTAYLYADSARAQLRGMTITFYDDDGRPRATVKALGGEWDERTDAMVARGDVELVVQTDGRKINSQELHYDPDRDRLWSDSATTQTLPDGTVTRGSSFESDLEFHNIQIRNIRGGRPGGS